MTMPPYERARLLNRQRSMANISSHSQGSTSSQLTLRPSSPDKPEPQIPLPPIPISTPPMITLPSGEQISLPDIMELLAIQRFSSPPHFYRTPTSMGPQPIFRNGCDRFPTRDLRWHTPSTYDPDRFEVLPGNFAYEVYTERWNGGTRRIDDSTIFNIFPERIFSGIHYRVDVNPIAWNNSPLLRGDIITFRGLDCDDIKYVVTWKRAAPISDDTTYVQVNAMGRHQEIVDSSDADWPTIGFYVPSHLCAVSLPPPSHIIPDTFGQISYTNPFTAQQILPPSPDEPPSPTIQRRNGEVEESDGFIKRLLKRKPSCLTDRTMD